MTDTTLKVFVGGISWKADEAQLRTFFETFGPVVECKIIMDRATGFSKGYGFVTFADAETAEHVKGQNNLYFLGKMMNVGPAYRKAPEVSPSGATTTAAMHQHYAAMPGYAQAGFMQQPPQSYLSYPTAATGAVGAAGTATTGAISSTTAAAGSTATDAAAQQMYAGYYDPYQAYYNQYYSHYNYGAQQGQYAYPQQQQQQQQQPGSPQQTQQQYQQQPQQQGTQQQQQYQQQYQAWQQTAQMGYPSAPGSGGVSSPSSNGAPGSNGAPSSGGAGGLLGDKPLGTGQQ